MDLAQWDQEVKPRLEGIRLNAGWISFYARKTEEHLSRLKVKPDFATEAEAALTETIPALEQALAKLKLCRDQFYAMAAERH